MLERNVVELARPSLDALSEASGETINLAVPARAGVEHVAQVDGRHFLGTGQWLGRTVDYHCTAVGKVFMAFGRATIDTGTRAAAPGTRPATITDPRAAARRAHPRAPHRAARPPSTSSSRASPRWRRPCAAPAATSSPR